MEEVSGFNFMVEKIRDHGEDSDPIFSIKEDTFAIAVFDGMGGAGAAKCNSDYGDNHTKAYVASRIIKECVEDLLSNQGKDITSQVLHDNIKERFKQEIEKYPLVKSTLRSNVVREYPTTMALLIASRDGNRTQIDSFWAGDSRNYLWTKDGFYQLCVDDITSGGDAMENLHNDSPLSNCISADQPFKINHKPVCIQEPCILLCATDGCFGYFQSPMHFEAVLKGSMKKANSFTQWKELVLRDISAVTGDDISLSLVVIPQLSFSKIKESMLKDVKRFSEIRQLEESIQTAKQMLDEEQSKYNPLLQEIWGECKLEYEKYIK